MSAVGSTSGRGYPTDSQIAATLGRTAGSTVIQQFGTNPSISTTEEDIWDLGGAYPWPEAAETVRVAAGGDVADTAAGVGARKIKVFGLDETFALVEEEITLAGVSASAATTITFFRVYRAEVTEAGAYTGANTADILVENTVSLDTIICIQAGMGMSQSSMYTIPAGKEAVIINISTNVSANKPSIIKMKKRSNIDLVSAPFGALVTILQYSSLQGPVTPSIDAFEVIPEKTDIWFTGQADTGTSAADVSLSLFMVDV